MSEIPQKVCRICEKETASELINILLHNNDNNFQNLIQKFLACANVTYDITDKLPKYFCRNCISILNIAYNFKVKCEQTQEKFQKLLQIDNIQPTLLSIKIENVDVPTYNVDSCVDATLTFEQIFGSSSNVMEIEIKPVLKSECCDLKSIDIVNENKTEKLDVMDDNDQCIVYDESNNEKCEPPIKKSPISSQKKSSKEKHSNVTHPCKLCDRTFNCSRSLSLHMTCKHFELQINSALNNITTYECFICKNGKTFKEKRYLQGHMKAVHNSKKIKQSFPCEICGKSFAFDHNKRRHIKVVHLNERLFVCPICQKRFGSFVELENHENIHCDVRNFECTQCKESFKSKPYLQEHIRIKHNSGLPRSRQAKSSHLQNLSDNDRLKQEMHIIQQRREYNDKNRKCCEICGKIMVYNSLGEHMRMHFGIKPYKCQLCPKTFLNKLRLNLHTLVHTGEKPFKCEFCSKEFRQNSHLLNHRRTHTGEKPYKCRFCEKAFATTGNFAEHERLHTGEKPYKCSLCAEKFGNSKTLKKHAKSMHAGRESKALIYTLPPSSSRSTN